MKIYVKNHSRRNLKVYASASAMPKNIYAGAYLDDYGYAHFDYDSDDFDYDIIALATDVSNSFNREGVRYFYGFEYIKGVTSQEKSNFRKYIKHLGLGDLYANKSRDQDVVEFVHRGIDYFDRRCNLESFGVIIHVESTSSDSIVSEMNSYISDCCSGYNTNLRLIKQMYKYVTFDKDKAYDTMMKTHKYSSEEAENLVMIASAKLEELKKTNSLFEMKKFLPRELREGFENYLKFIDEESREIYRNLQGVNVLIFDDFLTSGATIKETIRYLRSINETNTLTVFTLIKQ